MAEKVGEKNPSVSKEYLSWEDIALIWLFFAVFVGFFLLMDSWFVWILLIVGLILPLPKIKEYLKKSGFRWFDTDTNNIKSGRTLSKKQIDYLKAPSVTIFGPFNYLIRRHWDIVLVIVLLGVLSWIGGFFVLLQFGGIIGTYYFGIEHGRRLAWNRNKWGGFDDFAHSEESWTPWSVAGAAILGLSLIYSAIRILSLMSDL